MLRKTLTAAYMHEKISIILIMKYQHWMGWQLNCKLFFNENVIEWSGKNDLKKKKKHWTQQQLKLM